MNEKEAILTLFRAHARLLALGWPAAMYAPKDTPIQVIEAGSTGIHEATRDEMGFWIHDKHDTMPDEMGFWIHDKHDTMPSCPVLFRRPPSDEQEKP